MADFTGDTHPDLATVALNRFDSENAQYVIEVRLSEGGHQFLLLTAPFGGVVVNPMDVTGDGNLDLVIRSARSHAAVALFLNDGQGHFFAAEPSTYPKILRETSSEQQFAPEHFYLIAALVSPRSYTIAGHKLITRNHQKQNDSLLFTNYGTPIQRLFSSGSDRAPPAFR
jgi:hypothetical protein